MKIGMVFYNSPSIHAPLDSVRRVGESLMQAVSGHHEVVFLSSEYLYASEERARQLSEEFVRECDVLVGMPNEAILAARHRTGSRARFIGFLLGVMPRGAWAFKDLLHLLTSRDVLIANCIGEQRLARQFFKNAEVRLIPLAFDRRIFYPLSEEERRDVRSSLGLSDEDRVLIYLGRVTLEKNLHTVLAIFNIVERLVPNLHLLVAGPVMASSFLEFGVLSLNLMAAIRKAVARLAIPNGRVRFLGYTEGNRVRELLNIAELKLNMTLHHDENFGLAQVQAMACGTPVVGTAWGGLNDTIIDGTSGYKVSAVPTLLGVKVDWWEAVNLIVKILNDRNERERMRDSCVRHANACYSQSRFEDALLELLSSYDSKAEETVALQPTAFAEEFWDVCNFRVSDSAPFRRGRRSNELYQELMTPFSGRSASHVPNAESLLEEQLLSLAAPIDEAGPCRVRIEDPIYPFDVDVPPRYDNTLRLIVAILRTRPVVSVGQLRRLMTGTANAQATLGWMLEMGMLLRTRHVSGWVSPHQVDGVVQSAPFDLLRVDRATTDLIVY